MLRSEAVEVIQQSLLQVGADTAPAILRLQQAQNIIEKSPVLPWFLDATTTLTTVAGTKTITPPADFAMEIAEQPLYYIPSSGEPQEVYKDSEEYLKKNLYTPGPPQGWIWRGSLIELYPTPDAAYTLELAYSKKDDVLSTDMENLWLRYAPYWLIGAAGYLLAPSWRDAAGANFFVAIGSQEKELILEQTLERRYQNRTIVMGGVN